MEKKYSRNNFLAWFIGFSDAEGNFQSTKVKRINKKGELTSIGLKYSIHFGLHIRDRKILELIQSEFNNIGKIYDYENKNESHLAIVKIEDLKWLIENVYSFHPLLTEYQYNRYNILKLGILNNIKSFKTENELYDYFNNIDRASIHLLNLLNLEYKSFLDM